LLGVGERGEHVGAVDVLLDQQLLVRRVAGEHDGVLEQLRYPARAALVALDQLHLARFLQGAGEAKADVATAREDYAAYSRVLLAQLADHPPDVIARGKKKYFIAFFDDRGAIRGNAAAAAVDGDDARLQAGQVVRQLPQAMADQQSAADGAHAH